MGNVKRGLEEAQFVFAHLDGPAVIAANTLISVIPTPVHSKAIAQAFPEAFIVPAVRDFKENTALKVLPCEKLPTCIQPLHCSLKSLD